MRPCCPMCYAKYIHEDGLLDREAYEAARLERIAPPKDKLRRTVLQQRRVEEQLPPLLNHDIPCLCECHIVGNDTMH